MKCEPVGAGRSQKYSTPSLITRRVPLYRVPTTVTAGAPFVGFDAAAAGAGLAIAEGAAVGGTVVPAARSGATCCPGACNAQAVSRRAEAQMRTSKTSAFFIVVLRCDNDAGRIVRAPD